MTTNIQNTDWRDEPMKMSSELMGNFGWVGFVLIGLTLGFVLFSGDGFVTNAYTEGISIIITVVIVNRLAIQRETNEARKRLPRQVGSASHAIAIAAVDELRDREWLVGDQGLLQSRDLRVANLERADLRRANLKGADLRWANLQQATFKNATLSGANLSEANLNGGYMWFTDFRMSVMEKIDLSNAYMYEADLGWSKLHEANLSGAKLVKANFIAAEMSDINLQGASLLDAFLGGVTLSHANISNANLRKASLIYAYMKNANLSGADLRVTDLTEADLTGVNLYGCNFNENTILPDGNLWTPDTDMTRFTDPEHPDFWRSDDRRSLAYRNDE